MPATAYAEGDEPSEGQRPDKPPKTRARVLGIFVRREGCRRAVRLVEAYQQCRPRPGGTRYRFLSFPAEEPPSIECNEDVGEEDSDD